MERHVFLPFSLQELSEISVGWILRGLLSGLLGAGDKEGTKSIREDRHKENKNEVEYTPY